MKAQARAPEVPALGLGAIDIKTGELIDYDRLQPYMEKAGYLPALAYKLYKENES